MINRLEGASQEAKRKCEMRYINFHCEAPEPDADTALALFHIGYTGTASPARAVLGAAGARAPPGAQPLTALAV
jgi:hypothetical protein